ncbi:MAG: MBL fold metallo-hydrolase [Candidatus Rokuibacteriota bacterium]|nr:MAG: MBL fold metallo-hydrolase [Candidatus Rokubacteria bacterium]
MSEVVPGVWHWHLSDERIGGATGAAHAVRSGSSVVLVDPLPLVPQAMESLGSVEASCLTTSGHQRSCFRLRRELGAPVFAPAGAQAVEEEPDGRYDAGDRLPGGLLAYFTPGAGTRQFSLLLERDGGVLFTPDLFMNPPHGEFGLVSAQYMHDPEQVRVSIESLLDLDFSVLCMGHGIPVAQDPKAAIHAALASG